MKNETSEQENERRGTSELTRLLAPREIKFRAWVKRYEDGEWIMVNWSPDFFSDMSRVTSWSSKFPNKDEDVILMQFAGLKDKNGNEIYEGDILLFDDHKYMVYWFEEMATFQLTNVEGGMDDYFESGNNSVMEIIGNIFENPELISEC